MSLWKRHRASPILSWLVIGFAGALQGIYGRTQYLGDWISYLNVSRAVSGFDWKGIFDPMWSPGYPALVALMRALFPRTAEGEWHAISLLNWLIFLCAYAAWRYLLRAALELYDPSLVNLRNHPVVIWITCCAFLSCALCFATVSGVSPDLTVGMLFLLAVAETLRLLTRPAARHAVLLGATLGVGYWVKGIFLPLSAVVLLMLVPACLAGKISWRIFLAAAAAYLALFLPFVAAISWSYGALTLGQSGPLNYAFHVNHLPHWTNWQGGPSRFGYPLHPTTQLLPDLPVFAFGAPFHSTYPPYNNIAYWYRGFRSSFSMRREAVAIARSCDFLGQIVIAHPFLWGLIAAFFAAAVNGEWRRSMGKAATALRPLFLPAALGIAIYLLVHIEDRYLGSFFLILSLLPLTPLLTPEAKSRRLLAVVLLAVFTVSASAELAVNAGNAFRAALHRQDFHDDPQWKLAAALSSYGAAGGDAVALIDNGLPGYRCYWAYIAHLRIVAEFGSLPWTLAPWDRTRFDHVRSAPADTNYGQLFWRLKPGRRARVIQALCGTGARMIVSLTMPGTTPGTMPGTIPEPGWVPVGDTGAWAYRCGSPAQ